MPLSCLGFTTTWGDVAVAKVVLKVMTSCGINATLLKHHSLRGANATALMAAGIDQTLNLTKKGGVRFKIF